MAKKKKKKPRDRDEAAYICPTCGEEIVIPIDRSSGGEQSYVEDCPVCCHPNIIHVELLEQESPEEGGEIRVWAESE